MRIGKDHLVALVQERGEGQEKGRRGSRGDTDLVGMHRNPVAGLVMFRDGLPKLDHAQRVGVFGKIFLEGLHAGPLHTGGRRKVRLA